MKSLNTKAVDLSFYNLDDLVNLVWSRNCNEDSTLKVFLNLGKERYPQDLINELVREALLVGVEVKTIQ